jgi:hypothetical protein
VRRGLTTLLNIETTVIVRMQPKVDNSQKESDGNMNSQEISLWYLKMHYFPHLPP